MYRTAVVIGTVCLVLAFGACSSGGGAAPSATTSPSTAGTASPMPDDAALATRLAGSLATRLGPELLDAGDYPPDLTGKQAQAKRLTESDVPGLSGPADGFFGTVASADGAEFVNVIAIVPDVRADVSPLLDALQPADYLPGLTSGARDATSAPVTLEHAPPGAVGFTYTGTVPSQNQPRPLTGEVVGFAHGSVFVLLVHGVYASSTRGINVGQIATAIDGRLGGVREAD